MKKFLAWTISILLILVVTIVGLVGFKGYKEYDRLVSTTAIESMIEQIENNPDFVPYDYLPHELIRATVAIEDKRFYDHGGVDYIGLTRAIVSQFLPDLFQQSGGSTITQQLAKNMYNMWESSLERKASEYFFAKELEKKYSKQDIITYYVNVINYGDGYIGIKQASYGYFGKEPEDLSVAQCSILAGIPQSPANYQLSNNYDRAKTKQKVVLEKMVECHYLTQDEVEPIWNTSIYE